ncbi:hypothetical protein [Streptomyces sp. NPDC058735]|uniref:hypothetical protein n=1 Tax=unclassified Streptomyces TaxID=2593676 RepID=UPI0036C2529D
MSITQQFLLDTYRARSLGAPTPPAPGRHVWQLVREWRDEREFRAALTDHTHHRARGRLRDVLERWSRPGRRRAARRAKAPVGPKG